MSQGGVLHPGITDKSLSKPQLESSEKLSVAWFCSQRGGNHTGVFCPGEEDQASADKMTRR